MSAIAPDQDLIRAAALAVPLAYLGVVLAWRRPDRREGGAALLAGLWALATLPLMNELARVAGWWTFAINGVSSAIPWELLAGWVVLWGPLPFLLFPRAPLGLVIVGFLAADLLLMPRLAPVVQLHAAWVLGDVVMAAVALAPAQWLARLTAGRRRLRVRVLAQMLLFCMLAFIGLPMLSAAAGPDIGVRLPRLPLGAAAQLALLGAAPALAAVRELYLAGGTPYPWDPPPRLAVRGPYAYVRNPMQVGIAVLLPVAALLLGDVWLLAGTVSAVAFSAGLAAWHEDTLLAERFGAEWQAYRAAVRAWMPRARPWVAPGQRPILWVAKGCDPCSELGGWLAARSPGGLDIRPAEQHPLPLPRRLTYSSPDGITEQGIRAVGRALQHLHLGWAWLGWLLTLPLVASLIQLLADASGAGARALSIPAQRRR